MMTFLLIIILGMLAWNYLLPYLLRRQIRKTFGFDTRRQTRQSNHRPEPPRRQEKKIDPSVGEYVDFTETTETTARKTPDQTETSSRIEQQITDVQWEDLP